MSVTRLITVPASMLHVDPSIAQQSPKGFSEQDLRRIALDVPEVYRRMGQGWQEADFARARQSADPQDRAIAETYDKLWRDSSVSQSLHAHADGQQLEVDAGNHRIRAAQSAGVPALPVNVHASSAPELSRAESMCEQRLALEGSSQYSQIQQQYDASRTMSAQAQPSADWGMRADLTTTQQEERTNDRTW